MSVGHKEFGGKWNDTTPVFVVDWNAKELYIERLFATKENTFNRKDAEELYKCLEDFLRGDDKEIEFVAFAKALHELEGDLEFDPNTGEVSRCGNERGAYVKTWKWVDNPACDKCGEKIEGRPVWKDGKPRCEECPEPEPEEEGD